MCMNTERILMDARCYMIQKLTLSETCLCSLMCMLQWSVRVRVHFFRNDPGVNLMQLELNRTY